MRHKSRTCVHVGGAITWPSRSPGTIRFIRAAAAMIRQRPWAVGVVRSRGDDACGPLMRTSCAITDQRDGSWD